MAHFRWLLMANGFKLLVRGDNNVFGMSLDMGKTFVVRLTAA
jgi:hypothetical protein